MAERKKRRRRRSGESRGMIETRESKGVNVQRRNVSALTVTAQIRRRSRDRGAVLQKGKKSKRTCHTRRSLAPSPALHVASLSRSFSLFLSLCPPVWSGPCVIGAESLRFGGTWTVAKKERSRASVDSSEQHRALRYLAGSKIAPSLLSPPPPLPPPPSPLLPLLLLLLLPLLPLLLLGPRATGSLEPPGNSLGRSTSSHFYIPRTRSRLSLCFSVVARCVVVSRRVPFGPFVAIAFPRPSSLTRSPAACISGCSEHAIITSIPRHDYFHH